MSAGETGRLYFTEEQRAAPEWRRRANSGREARRSAAARMMGAGRKTLGSLFCTAWREFLVARLCGRPPIVGGCRQLGVRAAQRRRSPSRLLRGGVLPRRTRGWIAEAVRSADECLRRGLRCRRWRCAGTGSGCACGPEEMNGGGSTVSLGRR